MSGQILSENPLFDGRFLHAKLLTVRLEDGSTVQREIVNNKAAVAVVPLWTDGTVSLVSQYRAPIDAQSIEVPAGLIDSGEEPLHAAQRELSEETGITAGRWHPLGKVASSPGFSTEIVYLYAATQLAQGKPHFDEDEVLSWLRIPLQEAYEMVLSGIICNASTVSAILLCMQAIDKGTIVF